MLQGVYQCGLGNDVIVYVGGVFIGSYMFGLMGVVLNMLVGGFFGDVMLVCIEVFGDDCFSGFSYCFVYSKNLLNIGINFLLFVYCYFIGGYFGLCDVVFMQDWVE